MKKRKANAPAPGPVQCYICQTIDERTPPFAVYSICTRCLELTPLQIFKLPPDQKKRAAIAFLANCYLPELAEKVSDLVDKHLPKLSPGTKRR